jgi:8-hydroxy-5-deazaflavin:NADPH oxidoreductase
MKKYGVVGSGTVGKVLADGLLKHGYEVMRGSRTPGKLAEWKSGAGSRAHTGTFAETARFGEVIILAVKGTAAESAVNECGEETLSGKIVIDTTNPIADKPPVHGVLSFFTGPNESLMEKLQRKVPQAHFVKAFSCVGNGSMVNPDFGGNRPTMFICGDNTNAKREVSGLLDRFGWEVEDMGTIEAARAIEPLCVLWCIPGLREDRWNHAFKLLKK